MAPNQETFFASHYDDLTIKGYSIIPANGKLPALTNWQNSRPLPEWKTAYATCNVGILTGYDIIAVDIDILNPLLTPLIKQSAIETFGPASCRYGKKPKCLLVFRINEEIRKHKITFNDSTGNAHAVEILAKGQQFIAYGIHPDTKLAYEWDTELLPVAELTLVTLEALRSWLKSLESVLAEHNCTNFKITGLDKPEVYKSILPIDLYDHLQAKAVVDRLKTALLKANIGDRHAMRLKIAKAFGGYIAGGLVYENDALDALQAASDAISDGDVTSASEWQTILEAIEHGKKLPITSYGAPIDSYNEVLDNETHHCTVDLLQHLDDDHPLKELSLHASQAMDLPANTTFLIGLTIFSTVACRKYFVNYQYADDVPIGIYAVAEQPSGVGKSRCLTLFQKPFFQIHKTMSDLYCLELKNLEKIEKSQLTDDAKIRLAELKDNPVPTLFTTNTTPEALEKSLDVTNGFFSAVSSEQGLFNSLFGLSYTDGKKANNNDLMLNGFDGGYMSSMRVTRDGYRGYVVGGVALFAQQGSIETLLNASNGTGLSERFLMLAESHRLGKRDHTISKHIPQQIIDKYANVAKKICFAVLSKQSKVALNISDNGHNLIALYKNEIEPHLADGGKYSHISLRGAAGKINMQIMKLAANLHLLAHDYNVNDNLCPLLVIRDDENKVDDEVELLIDDKHVISAIGIANELLEANLNLCHDKGILGVKAEYTAVLNYLSRKGSATERDMLNSLRTTLPFKDFTGDKTKEIKKTIVAMATENILTQQALVNGKNLYSIA